MNNGRGEARKGAGRSPGSLTGKKERVTTNVASENQQWLKKQEESYLSERRMSRVSEFDVRIKAVSLHLRESA